MPAHLLLAEYTFGHQYRYTPFGEPLLASEAAPNPLRFAAREYDGQAGLYYVRARWYDPFLGRFVSEDPIGLEGGINLYAYAANDPINLSDPSGLHHVCEHTAWATGDFMEGTFIMHFVPGCWDFGHDPRSRYDDGDEPGHYAPTTRSACAVAEPPCVLRDPTTEEWVEIINIIVHSKTTPPFCQDMQAAGLAMIGRQLSIITNRAWFEGQMIWGEGPEDPQRGGPVMYIHWALRGSERARTVLHESVHGVLRTTFASGDVMYYPDVDSASSFFATPLGTPDQAASRCMGRF